MRTNQQQKESVGRKYELTCYAVLSRRIGGDGKWYGRDNYRTLKEAQDAIHQSINRYQNVGGIVVDYGPAKDLYERKLVKVVKQCEVLEIRSDYL